MRMNSQTDFAIRMALYLALAGRLCTSAELSEAAGIQRPFAIKIGKRLANGGVVTAVMGHVGGYELARDASDVSLLDIAVAMGNAPEVSLSEGASSDIDAAVFEAYSSFYATLENDMRAVLSSITLNDLAEACRSSFTKD